MKPTPVTILDNEPDSSTPKDLSSKFDNPDETASNIDSNPSNDKNITQALQSPLSNDVDLDFELNDELLALPKKITQNRNKKPTRLYLVIPIIFGLLVIIYLYYPSSINNNPTAKHNSNSKLAPRFEFPEQKLEIIAERLIENSNLWNPSDINNFIEMWNSLSKPMRQDLVDTIWYKHFAFVIANKLKEITRHKSSNAMLVGSNASPILTLAFTLDIINSDHQFSNRRSENEKFNQLLANVKSELSLLDSAQFSDSNNDSPSPLLNDALRQEFEVLPSQSMRPLQEVTREGNTLNTINKPAILITGNKIRELLTAFKAAYKAGDAEKIQALFINDAQSSDSTLLNDLLDSYKSIFNNSDSRFVNFNNLHWKYSGYTATATGQYQADITLPENNGTQITNATIALELYLLDAQLKIAKIILQDKKITESNPNTLPVLEARIEEMPFLATEDVPIIPTVVSPPNKDELSNVMGNFISAYESGDIEKLASVFSQNIITNDKSGLIFIKQDYINLFAKSSARKMKIEKLKWKINNDYAKGTGNLSASITMLEKNSVNHVNGKIQFIVKRIKNNIVITHLYHIDRSQ